MPPLSLYSEVTLETQTLACGIVKRERERKVLEEGVKLGPSIEFQLLVLVSFKCEMFTNT